MTEIIVMGHETDPAIAYDDFPPEYGSILGALASRNVPYAVIGAVAISLTAGERLTRDIDAICPDVFKIVEILYQNGFVVVSGPVRSEPGAWVAFESAESALRSMTENESSSFKAIHVRKGYSMDIWIKSPDENRISLQQILVSAVPGKLGGNQVRRACAEDLLELKKIALAANPARAPKDAGDIVHLEDYISRKPERKR